MINNQATSNCNRVVTWVHCRDSDAAFTFVVNFMVPGPPYRNLVMSWSSDALPPGWAPPAFTVSGEMLHLQSLQRNGDRCRAAKHHIRATAASIIPFHSTAIGSICTPEVLLVSAAAIHL